MPSFRFTVDGLSKSVPQKNRMIPVDIGDPAVADAESVTDGQQKDFAEGLLAQHLAVPDFTAQEPSLKTL